MVVVGWEGCVDVGVAERSAAPFGAHGQIIAFGSRG